MFSEIKDADLCFRISSLLVFLCAGSMHLIEEKKMNIVFQAIKLTSPLEIMLMAVMRIKSIKQESGCKQGFQFTPPQTPTILQGVKYVFFRHFNISLIYKDAHFL